MATEILAPLQLGVLSNEHDTRPQSQPSNMKTLAANLRGQTFTLPKLDTLFPSTWPSYIGAHYQELREIAEIKAAKLGYTGAKLTRLRAINCPLPASCWWPTATLEAGITFLYWFMFIFTWDDELEESHSRDVAGESLAAQNFRRDTLLFIEHCLGLNDTERNSKAPKAPSDGVATFTELGDLLTKQYTIVQRRRWFEEARFFFEMVRVEQEYIIADEIPSVEDFWAMRMGSSAVGQSNALGELVLGLDRGLPAYIHAHPSMQILFDETNRNISAVNDILSLKKELRDDCVLSLIPVCVYNEMELQTAIDTTWEFLKGVVESFEAAAERLVEFVESEGKGKEGDMELERTREFVDALRTTMTGNLLWSIKTDRYGLAKYKKADGSMVVTL